MSKNIEEKVSCEVAFQIFDKEVIKLTEIFELVNINDLNESELSEIFMKLTFCSDACKSLSTSFENVLKRHEEAGTSLIKRYVDKKNKDHIKKIILS